MSRPGPGGGSVDESYAGPPPTLRPAAGQSPVEPWPTARPAGPPPVVWPPPPGTPPHDEPQPFPFAMRSRTWAWWRPVVGLGLLGLAAAVAAALLGVVEILTGVAPDPALLGVTDPAVLLLTNVTVGLSIPVVFLAWAVAHDMRPGWSSSVRARLRWPLLSRSVLLALCSVGVALGLSVLLALDHGRAGIDGPIRSWGWFLVVVLLTTPLRAAAEESLFRGYLGQALTAWIGRRAAGPGVAAVVGAVLFSLAHLPPDLGTFLARFVLGLAASALVWLTGGLEAAIALHVVIDVLVLLVAGLLGQEVATQAMSAAPGPVALGLAGLAGYVALVALWRRRRPLETRTPALDLRPSAEPLERD